MESGQSSPKATVALVHDHFFIKGGAERMNVEIAKILGADIVASVFSASSYDLNAMGFHGSRVTIHPGYRRGLLGFIRMKLAFLLRASCLRNYHTVLFSNEAICARVWAKNARRIYYAHSISRHLFDQKREYAAKVPLWARPAFHLAGSILRKWYVSDLRNMDLILTNSERNAAFLRALAPRVTVAVLYPPVNTEEFFPLPEGEERGDYYLSYARLSHAKRIDRIIAAFRIMPEKRLLVLYGVNDPQTAEFMKLADGATNIEFRTLTDNSALPGIVRRAIAVVYVSQNEDFGMNTIEALASGVPVIAVAEGGFLETMVDGRTGILLLPQFEPEHLAAAVCQMTASRARELASECLRQAQRFSLRRFAAELRLHAGSPELAQVTPRRPIPFGDIA